MKKSECNKCNKIGHWAKVCHTGEQKDGSNSKFAFLSRVSAVGDREKRWTEVIKVGSVPIEFRLDTGAQVTVLPWTDFEAHFKIPDLQQPD